MIIQKLNIEKVVNYNYFLLYSNFILFIDIYFIFFKLSIFHINLEILKDNVGSIFILLFLFIFIMAVISKIINWLINAIYEYKFKDYKDRIDMADYIFATDLLNLAIKKNNSVLYDYYKQHQEIVQSIHSNQYLSTAILLLLICDFFVSTDVNISLIKIFILFLYNIKWYYALISIIPIGIIIYIFFSTLNSAELHYIYLPRNIQNKIFDDNESVSPQIE